MSRPAESAPAIATGCQVSKNTRPPTQNADAPQTYDAAPATQTTQTQSPYPDAPSPTPSEPDPTVQPTATTAQPATHSDRKTATQAEVPPSAAAYDASPSRLHSAARSSASLLFSW